jgi:CHAD domain-containing protein
VQLDRLRRLRLPTDARAAGRRLAEHLRHQRNNAYDALPDESIEPFDRLQPALRKMFAPVTARRRGDDDFSSVTMRALAEHAEALSRAVSAVSSLRDEKAIHAARIEGKRLRYLIEPLASAMPGADSLVARLKAFQDRFGELCDLFVLARTIEAAAGDQAAENAQRRAHQRWLGEVLNANNAAPAEAGLLALVGCVRGRAESLYSKLEREYLGGRIAGLTGPVSALVRQLQTRSPPRARPRARRVG